MSVGAEADPGDVGLAVRALPPGQKPTVFRDSDPRLAYPYNIHETDGLSRNPDDCVRWGCVDVNSW